MFELLGNQETLGSPTSLCHMPSRLPVLVSFRHCDQNNWQLKGRKVYIAHGFRGFSPWLVGLEAETSWPKGTEGENYLPPGNQQAERTGKSPGEEEATNQLESPRPGSRDPPRCALLVVSWVCFKLIELRANNLTATQTPECQALLPVTISSAPNILFTFQLTCFSPLILLLLWCRIQYLLHVWMPTFAMQMALDWPPWLCFHMSLSPEHP